MQEMSWKRLERDVLTWMALMDSYLRDSGRYHFQLETSLAGEERDYFQHSLLPLLPFQSSLLPSLASSLNNPKLQDLLLHKTADPYLILRSA